LRVEDPEGFELLATVPVQFRFLDATDDLRYVRPVVQRDHAGQVTGLAYSPRLDYLPIMSTVGTRAYQRARHRLSELLVDPEFEVRFTLQPGEVEVFDNSRVLHGRTGFDPQEGNRHLQGCYIDGDAPRSRYRMLNRAGGL
jgi:gamma-butyrobetaine dioxygenase